MFSIFYMSNGFWRTWVMPDPSAEAVSYPVKPIMTGVSSPNYSLIAFAVSMPLIFGMLKSRIMIL